MTAQKACSLLLTVLTAFVLTSCSDTSASDPGPATTTQSDIPQARPSGPSIAPNVADPLEATKLRGDPCSALSQQQTQRLGLKPGVRDTASFGPVCEYEYAEVIGNEVTIGVTKKFENGLANIYARKQAVEYFEETTVAGYPAVYSGKYDRRDSGSCQLHVGLTDNFAPTVFAQLSGGSDYGRPCQVAEKTAKTMIENLRG